MNCKSCRGGGFTFSERVFRNGTAHIAITCIDCGSHNGFVRMRLGPYNFTLDFFVQCREQFKSPYLKHKLNRVIKELSE